MKKDTDDGAQVVVERRVFKSGSKKCHNFGTKNSTEHQLTSKET
jgi:hypothetical protein